MSSELDSIFNDEWPEHHRSGVVAVVGRPNVGKSTLINHILGQKIAIVTPTPQTTRRHQLGIYTTEDVQILFVDTPGIHDPYHKLGEFMNRVATAALRDADAILWVLDITVPPTDEDKHIASLVSKVRQTPVVMALNKIDAVNEETIEERAALFNTLVDGADIHLISAAEGTRVKDMLEALVQHMPLGPRYYPKDQVSEVNLRFIATEVVREKVILNTYEEVPHAVAVGIDTFEEKPNDVYEIHSTIYVEKTSQKGIIIGTKGSMIKQIGIEARTELERIFGTTIHLFLHVKVLKNWRSDVRMMKRFGYDIPSDDN